MQSRKRSTNEKFSIRIRTTEFQVVADVGPRGILQPHEVFATQKELRSLLASDEKMWLKDSPFMSSLDRRELMAPNISGQSTKGAYGESCPRGGGFL